VTDVLAPPALDPGWLEDAAEMRAREPVVVARGLGVRYAGTGAAGPRAMFGRLVRRAPRRDVWALRGIDLSVRSGECLGIVGRNGAGKTTLLRVIAHLIDHDEGTIRVRGRISALLNLGVGFDPLLTGRENVELVGSLMGVDRAAIRERTPDVLEFADLGDFIDAPLRTYSSGMRARLGFATATSMVEPHVLLLDEVMGTGDAAFRERSRERVMELVQRAHAVVVASHDMAWISEFSSYAVLLEGGRIAAEGSPGGVTTLHRARAVTPPRRYGCESCQGRMSDSVCTVCGVWIKID